MPSTDLDLIFGFNQQYCGAVQCVRVCTVSKHGTSTLQKKSAHTALKRKKKTPDRKLDANHVVTHHLLPL